MGAISPLLPCSRPCLTPSELVLELPGCFSSLPSISVCESWEYRCTSAHTTVFFFTDVGQLSLAGRLPPPETFPTEPSLSPQGRLLQTHLSLVPATLRSFLLPAYPIGMFPAPNVLSSSVMSYLEAALVLN